MVSQQVVSVLGTLYLILFYSCLIKIIQIIQIVQIVQIVIHTRRLVCRQTHLVPA